MRLRTYLGQGLAKLLADSAPQCSKEQKFEDYFGRKIAIDASMHIYQFLVRCLVLRIAKCGASLCRSAALHADHY